MCRPDAKLKLSAITPRIKESRCALPYTAFVKPFIGEFIYKIMLVYFSLSNSQWTDIKLEKETVAY